MNWGLNMAHSISEIPADQRPRERLGALGSQALSDAELVALILGHGRRGQNVVELAGDLLVEHGGLAGLAIARPEELAQRAGVGSAKASALVAAFQLGSRARVASRSIRQIASSEDVALAVTPLFAGGRTERLLVLVCDAQDRILRSVTVAEGPIDHVPAPTREILNAVLRHDGSSFAVAHNHPSADPIPSPEDVEVTDRLIAAAAAVGLRFLDHVVIAGEQWASARSGHVAQAIG